MTEGTVARDSGTWYHTEEIMYGAPARGEGVPPLRVAGILPAGSCGIGILPMIHGLEAHATIWAAH